MISYSELRSQKLLNTLKIINLVLVYSLYSVDYGSDVQLKITDITDIYTIIDNELTAYLIEKNEASYNIT